MTQYVINIGALPNDGTGDPLRTAFNEVNLNFNQVWATGLVGSNIQIANNTILTSNTNGNLILNPNGIGSIIANAHIIPDQTRVRNLGSSSRYWDSIYVWYANVGGNLTISGGITVAGPSTFDGNVLINGNLQVEGNVTFIDSDVVDIKDKNITLAYGSPNAQVANGAGITIAGANAQMYYSYAGNTWTFNRPVATANIQFPDGSVLDTANTVYIGQTPNDKGDGNLWFNSDDGRGYVKYNSQWIEFSPTVIPNPSVYLGNLTINGANNSTLYFPPGGEIVFGDDTVQTTAWTGTANVDFTNVASSIIPSASNTYSLGNSTRWWTNAWFSSNTLYIGGTPIGVTANTLTVNGANVVTTSNTAQANIGNLEINGASLQIAAGAPETYININASLDGLAFLQIPNDATANTYNVRLHNDAGNIELSTDGGNNYWYFNKNGSLQFPSGAGFTKGSTGQLKTNDANTQSLDFRDSSGRGFYTDSNGYTLRSNGTYNWVFGTNGALSAAGNINTSGNISATGNVYANNLSIASDANVTGNISGSYYFGNAAYMSGVITGNTLSDPVFYVASDTLTLPALTGAGYAVGNATPITWLYDNDTTSWQSNQNITPSANVSKNLGATTLQWNNLYVANTVASGNIGAQNIAAVGDLSAGGILDIDGNARVGGNLVIVGNIDFSGGGSINQIVSANGVFTGNAEGAGALYAGTPGYTPVPDSIAQFTGDANKYQQINAQNLNHGNVASMEYVITGDLGTDTTDYLDIGFAGSGWDGTQDNSLGTAVKARDGYMYVQGGGGGGNLVIGTTTTGRVIKFNAGGPGSANTVAEIANTGITTTGIVSATGNVRGSNLNTAGQVSAAGNVTGNYILGNIAFATGVPSSTPAGSNTYVQFNDSGSFGGSGGLTFDKASGNLDVSGGFVNAAAVITSGRIGAGTSISAAGNVTGGNILTAGLISATGNVTGNYVLGNAAFMTGIPASYGNSNVATFLAAYGSNTISTSGNITAGNIIGNISITGNVTGTSSNVQLVAGSYTWTFDNTGNLSLPGNTFAVNYANGAQVSLGGGSSYGDSNVATLLATFGSNTVSTTGNVTSGNVNTSGLISAAGNITGGNIRTAGLVSATGNITSAGNIVFTANTSNIVFNNTAYISGNANSLGRDGSIVLQPYTGAGSIFPGVLIGGAGRILAPNGSAHLVLNASDVTVQVALKTISTTSTSTTTGGLQAAGGIGVVGNAYIGGSLVRTGAVNQSAWTTNGIGLVLPAAQYGDQTSAAGTVPATYIHAMGVPTLASVNAVSVTNAATLYVAAPIAGTGTTITNPWSIITNGNVQVNGTGGISIPNLPAFRVYGNGVTAVSTTTNTTGVLNGNNWAVDYNQGSYLNSTTGVFTAPLSGLYQVNLNMRVANNIAPTAQAIVIKNRGSANTAQVMWEAAANCTTNHFGVSTVSKLATGDTLSLVVAVGALTFDQNDSWSVAFLG